MLDKFSEVKKIWEQTEFEISTINDVLQAKGDLKLGASTTVALGLILSQLTTNISMISFCDQIGRSIELKELPRRIISLVPSQTELLFN
ncbi:unnamed protein product, partial [marine sediment metagenome]